MKTNTFIDDIYISQGSIHDIPFDDGEFSYVFPAYDDVPPGEYVVEIASVEKSITKSQRESIDVSYDLFSLKAIKNYLIDIDNGEEYELNPEYRIRQRYVRDTDSYRNTVSVLRKTNIPTLKSWGDLVGCCYVAKLGYSKDYGSLRLLWEYDEDCLREYFELD